MTRYAPLRAAAGLAVALAVLTGCANYAAPMGTSPPQPGSPTRVEPELHELPPPSEKVVAAVYRFRDQTGQYKSAETVASWSTAVTQGATSILIRALEESGWFVAIEREGLSNLLNERQIIQSIRAQYEGPEGEKLGPLPPLLYAGVLLEGGIIGYDTNLLTGGAGLRYFGAGGSGQFRQDQVTVYLRAVSTQTGRVLKTVHTTKTIASQQVEGGIFRFVEVDRLLESEIGYSYNEPPVVAVTEAIQEAVKNLILEGVQEGLWNLADPADREHPAFADHERDLRAATATDAFGFRRDVDRQGLGAHIRGGASQYQGNYRDPLVRAAGELGISWTGAGRWGVGLAASLGQLGAEGAFETTSITADLRSRYTLIPWSDLSPFFEVGIGMLKLDRDGVSMELGEDLFPVAVVGGGLERIVAPGLGLTLGLYNQYALLDGLDGVTEGHGHDSVWYAALGISIY